jgi:hypothetical protein
MLQNVIRDIQIIIYKVMFYYNEIEIYRGSKSAAVTTICPIGATLSW